MLASSLLLICVGAVGVQAQITSFKHVVVIVQENRTPDNLFQGLMQPAVRFAAELQHGAIVFVAKEALSNGGSSGAECL